MDFFEGRLWAGNLHRAVRWGLAKGLAFGSPFVWLTQTNRAATAVSEALIVVSVRMCFGGHVWSTVVQTVDVRVCQCFMSGFVWC